MMLSHSDGRTSRSPILSIALLVVCAASAFMFTACSSTTSDRSPSDANNRAIVVSFDALNEAILRRTLTEEQVPAFYRVFDQGRCAEHAQTAFPSLTASSHAAIWTGAYGDVTGITANSQHVLPRPENTVLDSRSGFSYEGLMAEPFWVTAAKNGFASAGHHVTQAPFAGGFPSADGNPNSELTARADAQREILEQDNVTVFNGYNRQVLFDGVVGASDVSWEEAGLWEGGDQLSEGLEAKAFSYDTRAGTFYGLLHGQEEYTTMYMARSRTLDDAVQVEFHAEETASPRERELARYFSEPLLVELEDGEEGYLPFRLFDVSSGGEDFMLYHPAMHVSESNSTDAQREYHHAVRGWFGNSSMRTYSRGGLGETFMDDGDGRAELRFLETAELLTKVFNTGSEWLWNQKQPAVMADYFPLTDTVDHNILGYLSQEYPGYDGDIAAQAAELRSRAWELADIRLELLLDLAQQGGGSLFITGDHGMRPTWRQFHPNVALREAGLLVLDDEGEIDLSQTRAVSPNGYWITINTTDWKEGIVSAEEKDEVIAQVKQALESVMTEQGAPLINRVYIATEHPELGVGGPAGGDVYWNMNPEFRSSRSANRDAAVNDTNLWSGHGFDSTDADMYTAFCGYGETFSPGRIPAVRTVDIAPTLGELIGFGSPQDAVGRSMLGQMREN